MFYELPAIRQYPSKFLYIRVYFDEGHMLECDRNQVHSTLALDRDPIFEIGAAFIIEVIQSPITDYYLGYLREGHDCRLLYALGNKFTYPRDAYRAAVDKIEQRGLRWHEKYGKDGLREPEWYWDDNLK